MTNYTLPVNETTLKQFMVEVTTAKDEEFAYYIFDDECVDAHGVATDWCNEDEAENGDTAEYTDCDEYGVFDNPDCCDIAFINDCLQRQHGEGVRIVGDRIEFDNFDYAWIPNGWDALDTDMYATVEEWAEDNELDLQVA
jgi:hypothetical protein